MSTPMAANYKERVVVDAVCFSVLFIKMVVTSSMQGAAKFKAGMRPPEDAKFAPGQAAQSFGAVMPASPEQAAAKENAERWNRIMANDLENIPITLILALLDSGNNVAHVVILLLFTVMRLLHTICFANSIMPARSIVWSIALLATFALVGNILYGAERIYQQLD